MNKMTNIFLSMLLPAVFACTPDNVQGEGSKDKVEFPDTGNSVVETYQYPVGNAGPEDITDSKLILPSSIYKVHVQGEEQFVFFTGASQEEVFKANPSFVNTNGIDQPHVCAFGCDGTVKVEISLVNAGISQCEVMPVSKKPLYENTGDKLTLIMQPYDRYVVKLNGNEKNILMVFANPLQSQMGVAEDDPNVIRFKAGKVYNKEVIYPKDGEIVFIEGGAVVFGRIEGNKVSCHVNGPGVLYCYPEYNYKGVYLHECHDCTLKNTIVLNKSAWATAVCECTRVEMDNWHAISTCNPYDNWGVNNDTNDFFGSNTCSVKRSFSYSHDDAFCIKSHKFNWIGEVYDISYDDCVSYAVDGGNGIDLGYELNEDVRNISYKNIYICRSNGTRTEMRRGGIALHNAAGGTVDGVTYENIYVEDPREWGFHMAILKSSYSIGINQETKEEQYWSKPGKVKNVKVKNLHILKPSPYGFYISGYDAGEYKNSEETKFNVEFDGLYIEGKRINSLEEFKALPNVTIKHANVTIK